MKLTLGGRMQYVPLQKLFYMDVTTNRYESNVRMARERLEAPSTFRTGIEGKDGEFFLAVPRELSLLTEKVLRLERLISQHFRTMPETVQVALIRNLVAEEVVSTNRLEQVHSTRKQIIDLLDQKKRPGDDKPRRFLQLATLYENLSDPETRIPQSPEDIREIYDLLMCEEPLADEDRPDGKLFRRRDIVVAGAGGRILHVGLHPKKIRAALEQLLSLMQSPEIPDVYSAILGHCIFEYIHPFYDGNGRTGRYLLALYLSKSLSILTSLSLSKSIAQNQDAYYRSLKEAGHPLNHGELTFFVINIMENILVAQNEMRAKLENGHQQLYDMLDQHELLCRDYSLSEMEAKAMLLFSQIYLFGSSDVYQSDVERYLDLGKSQARRYTKRLQDRGLIASAGARPLRFTLSDGAAQYYAHIVEQKRELSP